MIPGTASDPDALLETAYKIASSAAGGGDIRNLCQVAASALLTLAGAAGSAVIRAVSPRDCLALAASDPTLQRQIESILATGGNCQRQVCCKSLANCPHAPAAPETGAAGSPIVFLACLPFELGPADPMWMRLFFSAGNRPQATQLEALGRNIQLVFDIGRVCLDQRRCLQAIDRAGAQITSGRTAAEIVKATVEHATAALNARGSIFWILDVDQHQVVTCLSSGFAYQSLLQVDYPTLKKIFAFESLEPVSINDARYDPRIPNLERFGKKRVVSLAGFPVAIGKTYLGLLAVYFGSPHRLVSHEQDFMASLAQQAAMALKATLYDHRNGKNTLQRTVAGMAAAIQAKDDLTHAHSLRVAQLAKWTAWNLGLPPAEVQIIHHAGLLHDIGKIGITDKVLAKLGCLDRQQMEQLRRHPEIGARILAELPGMQELVPMVRHHHERYDGKGYPDGLKQEAIPLGARILAVCDAAETMLYGRPNLPACSLSRTLEQLGAGAGTRFDPRIVSVVTAGLGKNPDLIGRSHPPAGQKSGLPPAGKSGRIAWFDLPPSF